MDEQQLPQLKPELHRFLDRYAPRSAATRIRPTPAASSRGCCAAATGATPRTSLSPCRSGCWCGARWGRRRSGSTTGATPRRACPRRSWPGCGARAGRSRRTSRRARGGAAWTSTRRAAGWAGTTTPPWRCWRRRSWCCGSGGWGKKEPQMTAPEVRALLSHLLDVRVWDIAGILKWSAWRRERNRRAAESRRKRRRAEQQPPRSKKKKPAL